MQTNFKPMTSLICQNILFVPERSLDSTQGSGQLESIAHAYHQRQKYLSRGKIPPLPVQPSQDGWPGIELSQNPAVCLLQFLYGHMLRPEHNMSEIIFLPIFIENSSLRFQPIE